MVNPAGLRLLVVHDHQDARELLQRAAKTAGFDCRATWDAQQAKRTASSFKPHAAIIDANLQMQDATVASTLKATASKTFKQTWFTGKTDEEVRTLVANPPKELLENPEHVKQLRKLTQMLRQQPSGVELAEELLQQHPALRVTIISGAAEKEREQTHFRQLKRKHGKRVQMNSTYDILGKRGFLPKLARKLAEAR